MGDSKTAPDKTDKADKPADDGGDSSGSYLGQLVAYQSLKRCATTIAKAVSAELRGKPGAKVLIGDQLNRSTSDLPRLQLDSQIKVFEELFEQQDHLFEPFHPQPRKSFAGDSETKPAAGSASLLDLTTIGAVVGFIKDTLDYFQPEYTIANETYQLSDEALRLTVGGQLKPLATLMEIIPTRDSKLLNRISQLIRARVELDAQSAAVQASIDNPKSATDKTAAAEAIARWVALAKAFVDFLKLIATPVDDKQPSLLMLALVSEQMDIPGITHYLYLKIVSGGGQSVTQKRVWSAPKTAFAGGCVISYVLADKSGTLCLADTVTELTQFDYEIDSDEVSSLKVIPLKSARSYD